MGEKPRQPEDDTQGHLTLEKGNRERAEFEATSEDIVLYPPHYFDSRGPEDELRTTEGLETRIREFKEHMFLLENAGDERWRKGYLKIYQEALQKFEAELEERKKQK